MKKFIYLSFRTILILWMANSAFAMMCHGGGHEGEAVVQAASEETVDVGNKVCPVSGEHIKEGEEIKVEHEGKTYNLCCKACGKDFKKNPKKYIERLEIQEGKEHTEDEGRAGHYH